jgi:hypothetical protein
MLSHYRSRLRETVERWTAESFEASEYEWS